MIDTKDESIKTQHLHGSASIGRNVSVGGRLDVNGDTRYAHDVRIEGWLDAPNIRGVCVGLYLTEEELKEDRPEPRTGWYAIVAKDNDLPGIVYVAKNGEWVNTGKKGGNPSVDFATAKRVEIALDDETTARKDADIDLQEQITEEISNRDEADNNLQKNIDAEAKSRQEADEALSGDIDAEKYERQQAIDGVTQYVDNKVFGGEQIEEGAITESKIADESVSLEKMSPAMKQLIEGWNANEELVDTLPRDIISDITLVPDSEQVTFEGEVYKYNGNDDGYVPEFRYYQIPSATTDKAGVMTAQDKRDLASAKSMSEQSINDLSIGNNGDGSLVITAMHNDGNTNSLTIPTASSSSNGIMSSADKNNLERLIANGGVIAITDDDINNITV